MRRQVAPHPRSLLLAEAGDGSAPRLRVVKIGWCRALSERAMVTRVKGRTDL
jgi:hypothetical protein